MNTTGIPYYPGCSGLGTSLEYDMSSRAVMTALGVPPIDIPDWSCCGSTPAHTVNHVLSAALSARNLGLVAKMGHTSVTTPCPSCLTNLKVAEHKMEKPDFKRQVNALLDEPYTGEVTTKSVLQVLWETAGSEGVAARVKQSLSGIRVACYYGCIMNRPAKVMTFDDPEHPMVMDRLLEAAGADVVPFPLKVECCGAAFAIPRKDMVTTLSGKLLAVADELKVDALVTACPLCQMNLDLRQTQINKAGDTHYRIPIFYYTQLLGLAFGLPASSLGLKRLVVDPGPVLAKLNSPNISASPKGEDAQ